MIGIGCLSAALFLSGHAFYTTKITWSRDVSRIVYRHCGSCHRPGGSSFPLLTFAQARPWAEDIKEQVLERRMPPWNAVKGFGEFKDDAGLTQEDLEIIGEWVDGGVPEGNPAYAPPAPDFQLSQSESYEGEHRLTVLRARVIAHGVEAIGIEPDLLPATGAMQVIARQSDGAIKPLIWIEKFNQEFKRTYYFREPLHFPPGTRIEITPRGGRVDLIVK
jgi:hypothetical protein